VQALLDETVLAPEPEPDPVEALALAPEADPVELVPVAELGELDELALAPPAAAGPLDVDDDAAQPAARSPALSSGTTSNAFFTIFSLGNGRTLHLCPL